MSAELLVLIVPAVLYVFWKVMALTFSLIDMAHEQERQSEPRPHGASLGSERGD